jgi:hypothetical protein
MKYHRYKYIYPPRPERKIPSESLDKFEKEDKFLAQPKLNGSSMQIYTNGQVVIIMNRHKAALANKMNINELRKLHRGEGWMVLCGELMNKNQKDEEGNSWNHKFVIFDILVYNGEHLLKSTFEERYELLRKLYPDNPVKKHLHEITANTFRVHSVKSGFKEIFDDITPHQMYEGLVLKRADGKLENGTTEKNNIRTQMKCRKPTKNYAF